MKKISLLLLAALFPVALSAAQPAWPSEAWPSEAWPSEAWPAASQPAQAWPTQAWPTKVQPVQAWPSQAWPDGAAVSAAVAQKAASASAAQKLDALGANAQYEEYKTLSAAHKALISKLENSDLGDNSTAQFVTFRLEEIYQAASSLAEKDAFAAAVAVGVLDHPYTVCGTNTTLTRLADEVQIMFPSLKLNGADWYAAGFEDQRRTAALVAVRPYATPAIREVYPLYQALRNNLAAGKGNYRLVMQSAVDPLESMYDFVNGIENASVRAAVTDFVNASYPVRYEESGSVRNAVYSLRTLADQVQTQFPALQLKGAQWFDALN